MRTTLIEGHAPFETPLLRNHWLEQLDSASASNTHEKSCGCSACRAASENNTNENSLLGISESNFPDSILVSSTFGDITKDYMDWPNNSTITYTIFDNERESILWTTNEHSQEEEQFIFDTIEEVDSVIELDFTYSDQVFDSEIVFVSVDRYLPWGPGGVVGQVVEGPNRWFVLWKDSTPNSDELTDFDKNTITHELGHSIGLSHPGENPNNPRYNTVEDTIMSYNDLNGEWGTEFTENDYDALQMIWGAETTA